MHVCVLNAVTINSLLMRLPLALILSVVTLLVPCSRAGVITFEKYKVKVQLKK